MRHMQISATSATSVLSILFSCVGSLQLIVEICSGNVTFRGMMPNVYWRRK